MYHLVWGESARMTLSLGPWPSLRVTSCKFSIASAAEEARSYFTYATPAGPGRTQLQPRLPGRAALLPSTGYHQLCHANQNPPDACKRPPKRPGMGTPLSHVR